MSDIRRPVIDGGLYLLGATGLAASITLIFLGMRAVMGVGGFCAEGGPYVIETRCPLGLAEAMIVAFPGLFAFGGLMAWKGFSHGGVAGALPLLAWPALFLSLGWNSWSSGSRHPAVGWPGAG
ncbi:hypothetical protein BH23CHL7_BH23CHL7_22020 [soil metagenome]